MSAPSAFTFITAVVTLTSVAALIVAMPSIANPAIPLGVNIPHDRVGEPVVHESIRRYRRAVVVAYVVCLALVGVLVLLAPVMAPVVPLLVLLVVQTLVYLVARRPIKAAKSDEGWYDGVAVRRTAVIDEPSVKAPIQVGWFVASFLVLAVAVSAGLILYPSIPEQVPTHWNAAGEVTLWAAKSVWSVFGPLLIALGVNGLFLGIAWGIRAGMPLNLPARSTTADDKPAAARVEHVVQGVMGAIALAVTVLIAALSVQAWAGKALSGTMMLVMLLVPLLIIALVAVIPIMALRRREPERQPHEATQSSVPSIPDDDHLWKAGLFYVNRKNPSLLVPKRFGVGWTLNLGHPAGTAIMIGLVLVVVASLVLPSILR